MDVGQAALDAVVVVGQPLMIESEQMQDRGMEVIDRYWILTHPVADLVGRPVTEPRLQAGSGEPAGEGVLIMIAASLAFSERNSFTIARVI